MSNTDFCKEAGTPSLFKAPIVDFAREPTAPQSAPAPAGHPAKQAACEPLSTELATSLFGYLTDSSMPHRVQDGDIDRCDPCPAAALGTTPQTPTLPGTTLKTPDPGFRWNYAVNLATKFPFPTRPAAESAGKTVENTSEVGNGISYQRVSTPTQPAGEPQTATVLGAKIKDGGHLTATVGQQTTTKNAEASTQQRNTWTVGANGSVAYNERSTHDNGHGTKSSNGWGIEIDKDGPHFKATRSYTIGKFGASFDGSLGLNSASLGTELNAGFVRLGLKVDSTLNKLQTEVVEQDDHSATSELLSGGYIGSQLNNSHQFGGGMSLSNKIASIGVSGGVSDGTTLTFLEQLPANWDKLSQDKRDELVKAQQAELAGHTSLTDFDLKNLKGGTGVQLTTHGGWNVGAGVSVLGVGLGGGLERTSADQVTIVKDPATGKLVVDTRHQKADNVNVGVEALGFGIGWEDKNSNTSQFKFEVDPDNPAAMKELEQFCQTGLLPGADQLQGKPQRRAAETFQQSRGEVEKLSKELAALGGYDPFSISQFILWSNLRAAQRRLDESREYLNAQLQEQTSVNSFLTSGIEAIQKTEARQQSTGESASLPLVGKIESQRSGESLGHQQKRNAANGIDDTYVYDQQEYMMGMLFNQHSATVNSDENGIGFHMRSNSRLWHGSEASAIDKIRQSDLPRYVRQELRSDIQGQTTVDLTPQQLDGMTAYLNNTKDPNSESAKMWQSFGPRVAQFVGDGGYSPKGASLTMAQTLQHYEVWSDFRESLTDPASPTGKLFAKLPGSQDDPDAVLQALSVKFATITCPDAFSKLTVEEQHLFVQVIDKISGPAGDPSKAHNSFEALGPIALIKSNEVRSEALTNMYVEANHQAQAEHKDAVWEFVQFTDRFKDDPETYDAVQQAMRFHWQQDDVDKLAKGNNSDQLASQMKEAINRELPGFLLLSDRSFAPDTDKVVNLLQAAKMQGGSVEMEKVMRNAGADIDHIIRLLSYFGRDPLKQHMFYDLVMQTSYGPQLQAALVKFPPLSESHP